MLVSDHNSSEVESVHVRKRKAVNKSALVLRLRGLPYSATKAAIVEFFAEDGFRVALNDVTLLTWQFGKNIGKPSGEALVKVEGGN